MLRMRRAMRLLAMLTGLTSMVSGSAGHLLGGGTIGALRIVTLIALIEELKRNLEYMSGFLRSL